MSAEIISFRKKPKRETELEHLARLYHCLTPENQALIERLVGLLASNAASPDGAS